MSVLIDGDASPTLREHIGRLLSTCTSADIAVGHVRLAALDLEERETRGVRRCRILLGRLDARALSDVNVEHACDDRSMQSLCAFLESGRVAIRSAGLGAWAPDFSLYHGLEGGGHACLIGAHYFRVPLVAHGPSFTALLTDGHSVTTAAARFEAVWRLGHDVLEPVITAVRRRQSFSAA